MAERHTFQIYPGTDPADFQWHDVHGAWANTTGHPIYLKEIRWWMGASRGLVADCLGALWLSHSDTDTECILSAGWDRYSPDAHHFDYPPVVYAPDYVTMRPGEWLTLQRRIAPMARTRDDAKCPAPVPAEVLQVVRVWYTDAP